MRRRQLGVGWVAVALVGLAACRDPNLVRIEPPAAGVRVGHALAPGVARSGHVRVVNGARELEADAAWESLGDDVDAGGTRVRARFSAVQAVWPGADATVHEKVADAEVTIHVVTGGAAAATVAPTGHDLADAIAGELAEAVAHSFIVVPPKPLQRSDSWTWAPRGGPGEVRAAVEGHYRMRDTGLDVVEISLRPTGGASFERGRALFAIDGFVALYEISGRDGSRVAATFR